MTMPALGCTIIGLAMIVAAPTVSAEHVAIGPDGATLYSEPDDTAPVLGRIDPGQSGTSLAHQDDWIKILVWVRIVDGLLSQATGWVHTDAIASESAVGAVAEIKGQGSPIIVRPQGDGVAGSPTDLSLAIEGSPALAYSAKCEHVTDDGVVTTTDFDGLVPDTLVFDAVALACRVKKKDFLGRLVAMISIDGDIVAGAETLDPLNWVDVRSSGPWGEATGEEGNLRVLIQKKPPGTVVPPALQRVPHALSNSTVAPLSGNPVPPLSNP